MKNIEAAFTPTHSRPRFFAGTAASAVLDQLHKGLAHAQPFMLVLGTPGAGKTFDVLEACARWGTRAVTRWVDLRTTSTDAVLDTLLRAFDIDTPTQAGRRPRIEALARVSGETTRKSGHFIVIVDDAHDVPTAVLAELTRIVNEVRDARGELRAILAGHDALESRLADVALQGFAARTGARIRVVGMDVSDVRSYLHHVLAHAGVNAEGVFSRKSAREVHAFADGIPGRVDALATESARIAAKAGVTQVAPEHVRAANAALRLRETPPAHKPAATMAAPVATTEAPPASPAPVAPAIAPQPVPESSATVEPTAPAVAQDAPIADVQPSVSSDTPTANETPVVPTSEVAPASNVQAKPTAHDAKRRLSRKEARRAARANTQPATRPAPSTPVTTPTTDATPSTPTPVADPAPVADVTRSERPALPRPEAPPLDSAHPRVKEWVSRFEHAKNDRSGKLPPITTPDALPTFVAHRPASTVMSRRVVTVLRAGHTPVESASTAPVHDTLAKPSDPATNDTAIMPRPNVTTEPVAPAPSTPTASDSIVRAIPTAPVEPRDTTPMSDVVPTNVAPPVVAPSVISTPAPTPPARSTQDSSGTAPRHERPRTRRQRRAEQRARMAAQSGTAAPTPASSTPSGPRIAEVVAAAQPEPTPVATAPTHRPNGPRSPRHVEWLQGALPIVILIAVAVGAVMYSLRGGLDQYTLPSGRPAVSTPPVAVAPAPNPVDSALEPARYVVAPWPGATPVPVAGAPAPIAPAPTTEESPVTEAPATTPEPVTTTVTPAAARPAVDLPVPAFRLSVGTFLFQDRAQQRAREITRRTGLSARVKAMGPESARMWRVYVGEFTTETEAEAEADRLLSRGIVTEALVESIPGNASR